MRFPFNIGHRRIALAYADPGHVYVWDTEWTPPKPPDLRKPIWCGICWMRDFERDNGPIMFRRNPIIRTDVV